MKLVVDTRPYSILLVEENASDVFLLERALARQQVDYQLTHLRDGAEALAFVRREAPFDNSRRPDLILVDLTKFNISGGCVIHEVRNARHLDGVPFCVWFSAETLRDREPLKLLGVEQFIIKPSGLDQFMQIGKAVKDLLSGKLDEATPESL